MDNAYIAGLRGDYNRSVLNPEDLPSDPLRAFREWSADRIRAKQTG